MVAAAVLGVDYGTFMTTGLPGAPELPQGERDHARDLGAVNVVVVLGPMLGPMICAGLVALGGGF